MSVNGTLVANGTAIDSIYFTRYYTSPSYSYGGYISINPTSSNSCFSYISVDSLGYSYPITAQKSFTLTNSIFRNTSSSASIYLSSDTMSPIIQKCVFSGNENSRTISGWAGDFSNVSNNTNTIIYPYSSINQDSRWPNPGINSYYKIENQIIISNTKTLTIQPGAKVRIAYGATLSVNGTLIANGTAIDSVYFSRYYTSPSYAHGGYISINSTSSNSTFSYVSIDSLGYNFPITAQRSFTLTNSALRNSSSYAIYLNSDTISPRIQNCIFSGSENSRTIYGKASAFSNVSSNANAVLYPFSDINQNSRWPNPGPNSYYKIQGNITVGSGTILTVQPGTKIRITYGAALGVSGTLIANGTAIDSIYFTRFYTSPSYPYGGYISINPTSSNSSFSYVSFDSLGYNYPITANRSFTLTNSTIRNSSSYGIYLSSDTISPVIQNCTFSGNESSRSIYASAKCFSLTTNNTNVILRPTGDINSNIVWPKPGANSYYQIDNSITVNSGNVLTIEPGNIINFPNYYSYLSVNGTLKAQGTETATIQFIKLPGTGSGTYGGGVVLSNGSNNHILNYCIFNQLGGYTNYALEVITSSASLTNLSISNSNFYGIYISGASPTITSSNITSNPYGVYSASGKPVLNNCNIFANTSYGIYNASNITTDTVDASNCYWGDVSGPKHITLNPLGQGNIVTDKVKFNPWKIQPANGQIVDMGVSAIVKPITGCNLTSIDTVRVKLTNYGKIALANFPVSYRINSNTPITETVSASLLPGSSQEYTFSQKANLSTPSIYNIKVYTTAVSDSVPSNDTATTTIQHLAGVNAPTNLLPANNTNNVTLSVTLNWGAVPDVESYDLYVWKTTASIPSMPTVAGLTQISYAISTNVVQYGTAYNWKVVAKRSNCRSESIVQTFTTRPLPDLVLDSISVPPTATSETDITLRWKVKNTGQGSTGSTQWYDIVYISDQPILGVGTDVYIGQYQNFSALNSGESYTSANVTYSIPQGWQGNYYVIVKTNASGTLTEVVDTNNRRISLPINISLAPPPDLQVTSLVINPSTAFSEDSVTVNLSIQNLGTGPTTAMAWYDFIYLSKDTGLNINTATYLADIPHSTVLAVNGTYSITKRVKLPAQISGTYYVHVLTDRNNEVFEYIREDNNTRRSLPMNIILRPAPNLTVQNLSIFGDTVSNYRPINLQWVTHNEGAATAKPYWYEAIYYSPTATFNAATAVNLSSITRTDSIASLNSSPVQAIVQLPANLVEGSYYLFVKTDAYNNVFESTGENDNVSAASTPIVVANPDLKPVQLTAPSTAVSEQAINLSWTVRNISNTGIYNGSWSDYIFLSQDTILSINDIALAGLQVNQLLPAGSEYTRQASVSLPEAISGNYYFLMVTDRYGSLYEKSETNNVLYQPITITLAPWPDLQVSAITVPATDTVGSILQLQYTVQNSGSGAVLNRTITDYVYLTSVNNASSSSLTMIGSISQSRTLNSGSSYTQATSFTIPTSLNAGTYYVVIATDVNNAVFENTGENNNKSISTGIAMTSVPPIDLSVTAGQLLNSSVTAGQTASLQYTVKNNSAAATVIPAWQDAVYLSNNPVLDASDISLSAFSISGPLNAGSSYTQTRTVTIPNSVSGTLYLLVHTDKDNVHTDPNRGNNTLSINNGSSGGQTIVVTVPPPADLLIPSITAPAEATAAQPITIGFTVKNSGTGTTPVSYWTDNIYLSTDYTLDYSDIQIGSLTRSGVLASGGQYTGTIETTLPTTLSGNYILIVKADGGNNVYESNKANNLAFSNLYIATQPPSDLIVTRINTLPTLAIIGAPQAFGWRLKNVGANTASGYLKEVFYFSKDTLFDAGDILMGIREGYLNLPPGADTPRGIPFQMRGLLPGYYHPLVRTDILNNIVEQNDSNNTYISADTILVSIKSIPIDTIQYDVLSNNISSYYRIEVPANLAGETMSVRLFGDSARNALNRLYVRYVDVPNSNQYDVVGDVPFSANQEAIIPTLRAGTYYLMVLGTNTNSTLQTIGLLPRIIPFAITTVDAPKGGNTGAVTLKIAGAKFESSTTFVLRNGSSTIYPAQIYFINQTQVFVTYNLLGANLGYYNVVARKGNGDTTSLSNGFEIVQGPGSIVGTGSGSPGSGTGFLCQITNIGFEDNLQTDVLAPAAVRRVSTAIITINYKNIGSVDIPAPTRYLLSLSDSVHIGFTTAEFAEKKTSLVLECKEAGGPPGILRPGVSGFFKVFVQVGNLRRGTNGVSEIDFLITE